MRIKYFIFLMLFVLTGCAKELTAEQTYVTSLHVIGNEVYYMSDGELHRLSDTEFAAEGYGDICSEASGLYYAIEDGAIKSFDPAAGIETYICEIDSGIRNAKLKCVTENYILFGNSGENYALKLSDCSVTVIEDVFPNYVRIAAHDGDTVYFIEKSTVYSYSLKTGEARTVYTDPLKDSYIVQILVRGDVFYSVESLGYIYSFSGLHSGFVTEPRLLDGTSSRGKVIAAAGYDGGIYFTCFTKDNTLDLWRLANGESGENAEKLASWGNADYFLNGSGELSVSDSLVACCVTTDENCRIFTYEL